MMLFMAQPILVVVVVVVPQVAVDQHDLVVLVVVE
jgi:hypothetical protein